MAETDKTPNDADVQRASTAGQTHCVFKPASEMPVIKRAYVVQSPTPLGQRPVDQFKSRRARKGNAP